MKTILIVLLSVAIVLGAGYFGLPLLIEKETAGLKSDVQDLKQKLQKIEEESKIAPLQYDADVQKVIKTVKSRGSLATLSLLCGSYLALETVPLILPLYVRFKNLLINTLHSMN